jgi:hypothetical protein
LALPPTADFARVPRHIRSWSCLLLALLLVLGHSAGVQALAWAGMLLERSAERPLHEAIRSTFDGSEPCAICHLAADLRLAEQGAPLRDDRGPAIKTVKNDFLPSGGLTILPAVPPQAWRPGAAALPALPLTRNPAPEPPPPRA